MQDVKERPVLLVGSVPLGSSRAVFEAVGTKLGKLIKRVPDGETGARKDWIVWQADVFKNAKGLEPGSSRELQGGYHFILYKVKPGGNRQIWSAGICRRGDQLLRRFPAGPFRGQDSIRHTLSGQSAHADRGGDDIHRARRHSTHLADLRKASQ
jgi:hypothetical protein